MSQKGCEISKEVKDGVTNKIKPKVLIIVGPTASGKTSLAITLAKEFAGEVISADSRQVYQGLNIGTEKVTEQEMKNIPHHLLDVVSPETVYNASDFTRDAGNIIKQITDQNHLPIIAGGTFFYIDILLGKISTPAVAPNNDLRKELEDMPATELYSRLEKLDLKRAENMDPHNKRRLIRAIEVASTLGKVPEATTTECPYDVLTLGIKTDKVALRTRLRHRAQEALEKGLVEETKGLLARGLAKERLSEIGLEYRLCLDYIDGILTDAELIQKLEEKNWQYAKRQLTWLKHDNSIIWVDKNNTTEIISTVKTWLSN